MFTVEIKRTAHKLFKKLPSVTAKKIRTAITLLAQTENPEKEGLQLQGIKPKTFRIRAGSYRVIYRVDFQRKIIVIFKIGDRKNVYRA